MKCFAGLSLGFLAAVAHAFVGNIPLGGRSLTRGASYFSLEARPLVPSLTNRLSEARQKRCGRVTPLKCSGDIVWSKVCSSMTETGRKYDLLCMTVVFTCTVLSLRVSGVFRTSRAFSTLHQAMEKIQQTIFFLYCYTAVVLLQSRELPIFEVNIAVQQFVPPVEPESLGNQGTEGSACVPHSALQYH